MNFGDHTELRVTRNSLYFIGAFLSVSRSLGVVSLASVGVHADAATTPQLSLHDLQQLGAGAPLAPSLTAPAQVLREDDVGGEKQRS